MSQAEENAKRPEPDRDGRNGRLRRLTAAAAGLVCTVVVATGSAASGKPAVMIYVDDLGAAAVLPVNASTGVSVPEISMHGLLPVALALTPDGRRLYVVVVGSDEDGSPGSVVSVDTATDTLSRPIPVGSSPQEVTIAPDGKTVYVLGGDDLATTPATRPVSLTPIDVATGRIEAPIPVGSLPDAMALAPGGGELYVLDTSPTHPGTPTEITPVDLPSGRAGSPIRVAATQVVFTPNGQTAYAITSPPGLVPIDVARGTAERAISLGSALALNAAVTPDGKTLEVLGTPDPGLEDGSAAGASWTLTPVDVATGHAGRAITLGAHPGASTGSVTIAPDGRSADVLIDGTAAAAGVVVPVNLTTATAGAPIAVGREASALRFAPNGATAYVLDSGDDGALVAIDTATERARPSIPAGRSPLAFSLAAIPAAPMPAGAVAAHAAENLVATAALKAELVRAFAAARGLHVSEVAGTYSGSVFYAYDTATGTYWASASFDPSRSDSARVANTFQDAGSNGLFSRLRGGGWRFRGSGAPLACVEERVLPAAVARLWGVPPHLAGCAAP